MTAKSTDHRPMHPMPAIDLLLRTGLDSEHCHQIMLSARLPDRAFVHNLQALHDLLARVQPSTATAEATEATEFAAPSPQDDGEALRRSHTLLRLLEQAREQRGSPPLWGAVAARLDEEDRRRDTVRPCCICSVFSRTATVC